MQDSSNFKISSREQRFNDADRLVCRRQAAPPLNDVQGFAVIT
jgi:hypothetical protein